MSRILIILINILIRLSSQHFIHPVQSSCELAKKCNHTWVSICGQNQQDYSYRLFVDECDMHEYNCDTQKTYIRIEVKTCLYKCTQGKMPATDISLIPFYVKSSEPIQESHPSDSQTTVTSQIEMFNDNGSKVDTTHALPTSVEKTTATNNTEKAISTTNIMGSTSSTDYQTTREKETAYSVKSSEFTQVTHPSYSQTAETTQVYTFCNTTTENRDKEDYEYMSVNAEKERLKKSNTNQPVPTIEETVITTNTETTISEPSTIASVSPEEYKSSPIEPLNNKIITAKSERNTNATDNSISQSNDNITVTTKTTQEISTSNVSNMTATNANCSSYPKDCYVPSTWETTHKTEFRDFYQILRQRFGNKITFLRHTTHFPKSSQNVERNGIIFVAGHNDIRT